MESLETMCAALPEKLESPVNGVVGSKPAVVLPLAISTTASMAEHLARTAARLFATRGYDATSVREIVEAAGVTKPTLYHHFGSKEGLAKILLTEPMTKLIESCRQAVKVREGESSVEALIRLAWLQYEFCHEDPDRARFLYALLFGPSGADLSKELLEYSCRLLEFIMSATRQVAEERGLAAGDVSEFTRLFRGLIVITTMDVLYQNEELDSELPRRQVECLLNGFRPRSAEADAKIFSAEFNKGEPT